ncbi:MAG: helix-turn-helix transcriptional regulator [Rhodobacterales bacterium]|nr:helix-turn-helix transcriptional regulator [Rhodobacterales bacterium]
MSPETTANRAMLDELTERADSACVLMREMASPVRLAILCNLVSGEQSVGTIADLVGAKQPATSQHLTRLHRRGLVARRRDGATVYYRIADSRARAMLAALHGLFCRDGEAKGPLMAAA